MDNELTKEQQRFFNACDRLRAICDIENLDRLIVCTRMFEHYIERFENNGMKNNWKLEFDEQLNTITKIGRN